MTPADLTLLGLIAGLLIASGIASGSETALFGVSRRELSAMRSTAPGIAAAVVRLRRRPRRLLIAILVANMLINTLYFVAISALSRGAASPATAAGIGVAGVLAVVTFGEVLAKLLATARRRAFLALVARPMDIAIRALGWPLGVLDVWVLSPLSRLVVPSAARSAGVTARELLSILDRAGRDGHIDESERALLRSVIGLGEARVREMMTPMNAVRVVDLSDEYAHERALEAVRETGRCRVLVSTGGEGGELSLFDARSGAPVGPGVELPVVPEMICVSRALDQIRSAPAVLCADEHGRVTGMIDRDALVGWLTQLGEEVDGLASARLVGLGEWEVSGTSSARAWADAMGVDPAALPEGRATLSGVISAVLGRTPRAGDTVEAGGLRLRVRRAAGRSATLVRVSMADGGAS